MDQVKAVLPWREKEAGTIYLVLKADGRETEISTAPEGQHDVRLATFSPAGFRRAMDLPADLGLPLDNNGRIMLDE